MILAARERSLDLYHMLSANDAFERDDISIQYRMHEAKFIQARNQLVNMSLAAEEQKLLDEQTELTQTTVSIQKEIIDLINDDQIEQANRLLITTALPYKNRIIIDVLHKLSIFQQISATKITLQNKKNIHKTNIIILIVGILALSISMSIAINVAHRALKSEKKLHIKKNLAEVTLQSIGDAVITTNKNGIIKDMNIIAENLTGWHKQTALYLKLSHIFTIECEDKLCTIPNPLEEAINKNKIISPSKDTTLRRKDGKKYAIEYTAAPISDSNEVIHGGIIVFRDVTAMRTMARQLSYQASHDELTGLLNRREFEFLLEQAIGHAHREHKSHILCYMDLDQFKIINDTCGHIAGDELLKQIATRLKGQLRDSDVIARLGGDEFGVLLKGCSGHL